jgi:hypothetical protein
MSLVIDAWFPCVTSGESHTLTSTSPLVHVQETDARQLEEPTAMDTNPDTPSSDSQVGLPLLALVSLLLCVVVALGVDVVVLGGVVVVGCITNKQNLGHTQDLGRGS